MMVGPQVFALRVPGSHVHGLAALPSRRAGTWEHQEIDLPGARKTRQAETAAWAEQVEGLVAWTGGMSLSAPAQEGGPQ